MTVVQLPYKPIHDPAKPYHKLSRNQTNINFPPYHLYLGSVINTHHFIQLWCLPTTFADNSIIGLLRPAMEHKVKIKVMWCVLYTYIPEFFLLTLHGF